MTWEAIQLIDILRRHQGQFVSGAEIGRRLGVSRTAVWKQARALLQAGYAIEAQPRRGYCLHGLPDRFLPAEVLTGLATAWLGRSLYCYDEVGSTNQVAKGLADQGAPEGTLVLAEAQSGGRGRLGRSWFSPAGGGAYLSVILRPRVEPSLAGQVTLLAAVAVQAAVRVQAGVALGIKWPNDLLCEGRKACGILTEMKASMEAVDHLVLGIGLNINQQPEDFPPELAGLATSLAIAAGRPIPRLSLVQAVLAELERWYGVWREQGFEPVRAAWKAASVTLGRQVKLTAWGGETVSGQALDLDVTGALLLRDGSGAVRRCLAGEVSL